jgi:glucokinase
MAKSATIGIDIGGSKILFALFDEQFRVIDDDKVKTHAHRGEDHFTETLKEGVDALVHKARKKNLHLIAVGVGSTGSVNHARDTLDQCPNIPFLVHYPLKDRLAKWTGTNVFIANDVHAGLYGEQRLGAAKGARHVIGVFMGTGIGGALMIDGKLHFGATGHSGDIGNYLVEPLGPLSGSARRGVLDDIASRVAIAGDAAMLAAKQWAPHLLKSTGTDVMEIKSKDLAESIEEGDDAVEELVRSRARAVGVAVSNLADFINPDMVVLGGGMVEDMPVLIREEVCAGIQMNATAVTRKSLRVVVAKLGGHAVAAGAAKLALDLFQINSESR